MNLFVLLYLFMLIDGSYSCSKQRTYDVPKPKEVKHFIKRAFPGSYSTGLHKTQPACMNLRFTPNVRRTPDYRTSQPCATMIPGLSHMEHGCIKNMFYTSSNEQLHQHFNKVIYFTCDAKPGKSILKYKNYTIPSEILTITPSSKTSIDRRMVSIPEIIKSIEKDTNLLKTESNYLFNLPILRPNMESLKSAGYLSITIFTYDAKIRDDARPNQHVLSEYEKLPENWQDDINSYFEIISTFGTHLRESTIFGGSVMLLVSFSTLQKELANMNIDDDVSVASFVNDVVKLKAGQDTRISLQSVGGAATIQDFKKWASSIPEEPVPMISRYIPLNEFLDISSSKRSKSLAQIIMFEKDHQNYRKYSYQLKIANDTNDLSQFVVKMLSDQLKYICSSKYLNSIIEHGIERELNLKLDKFFVKFNSTKTTTENREKVQYVYENIINLIPNVCFTFHEQVQPCTEPLFKLPGNVKCVQFFEKENCVGKGTKLQNANQMNELLSKSKIKSIAMCDIA